MPFEHISWVKIGYSVFKDAYRYSTDYVRSPKKTGTNDLERHITEIESWSGSINMFGMAKSLSTDDASIAISISTQPRKFFRSSDRDATVDENQLLDSLSSFVILGDPGSGKTTIIKRLARKIILSDQIGIEDIIQFPLVILGRDIRGQNNLYKEVFDKIGFSLNPEIDEGAKKAGKNPITYRNDEMKRAACAIIAQANVLIFVDGLDEIDSRARSNFEKDIEHINNIMVNGKIIMTCRSGDWRRSISDFNIVEIKSLTDTDIRQIVSIWAGEPAQFMKSIAKIPYKDILDRPLFLTMLVIVYNQTGNLPDNPADVYHRVTNLLIEKWDIQRGVTRATKYEGFLPEKKFKFLCACAYHLTAVVKQKRFTSLALRGTVKTIGSRFNLPDWDTDLVVQEIESHTGIIVESGFEYFEFCHLTVQEFLAANYLVTMPNSRDATILLMHSPATVAVAVCLSASPQDYLLEIMIDFLLKNRYKGNIKDEANLLTVKSFVYRLSLERPVFIEGASLADSAFILLYFYDILSQKMQKDELYNHFDELNFIFESKYFLKSAHLSRQNWNVYRIAGSRVTIEIGKDAGRPRQLVELSLKAVEYLNRKESLRPLVVYLGGIQ